MLEDESLVGITAAHRRLSAQLQLQRLAKTRYRKSYQFVKQQKPITFSLDIKLTSCFSLIFLFQTKLCLFSLQKEFNLSK